jgi:hypothetical protein
MKTVFFFLASMLVGASVMLWLVRHEETSMIENLVTAQEELGDLQFPSLAQQVTGHKVLASRCD